jgi:hypothetical protein
MAASAELGRPIHLRVDRAISGRGSFLVFTKSSSAAGVADATGLRR